MRNDQQSFGERRLTTRRLMVAVAIFGLVFGVILMAHRRQRLLMIALRHEVLAELLRGDPFRSLAHQSLQEKYLRAAGHPWLSVEPDSLFQPVEVLP